MPADGRGTISHRATSCQLQLGLLVSGQELDRGLDMRFGTEWRGQNRPNSPSQALTSAPDSQDNRSGVPNPPMTCTAIPRGQEDVEGPSPGFVTRGLSSPKTHVARERSGLDVGRGCCRGYRDHQPPIGCFGRWLLIVLAGVEIPAEMVSTSPDWQGDGLAPEGGSASISAFGAISLGHPSSWQCPSAAIVCQREAKAVRAAS